MDPLECKIYQRLPSRTETLSSAHGQSNALTSHFLSDEDQKLDRKSHGRRSESTSQMLVSCQLDASSQGHDWKISHLWSDDLAFPKSSEPSLTILTIDCTSTWIQTDSDNFPHTKLSKELQSSCQSENPSPFTPLKLNVRELGFTLQNHGETHDQL